MVRSISLQLQRCDPRLKSQLEWSTTAITRVNNPCTDRWECIQHITIREKCPCTSKLEWNSHTDQNERGDQHCN